MVDSSKNFIDFVVEAKDRPDLYDGFLNSSSAQEMTDFFKNKGFTVSPEDCEKLVKAKEDLGMEAGRIPPAY
jgi:hypothetical protein